MKQRRRLHWAWRVMVAVATASLYGGISVGLVHPWQWLGDCLHRALVEPYLLPLIRLAGLNGNRWDNGIGIAFVYFLPTSLLCLGTYGLLTRYFGPGPGDAETRCRKCRYILRGITEPRCPECGEVI